MNDQRGEEGGRLIFRTSINIHHCVEGSLLPGPLPCPARTPICGQRVPVNEGLLDAHCEAWRGVARHGIGRMHASENCCGTKFRRERVSGIGRGQSLFVPWTVWRLRKLRVRSVKFKFVQGAISKSTKTWVVLNFLSP